LRTIADTEAAIGSGGITVRWKVGLAIGATILFWASAFAGIRVALHGYSPLQVAGLRYLVAFLVLIGLTAFRQRTWPKRKDLPLIAAAGAVGIAGYNVLLNYGELAVSAGAASFMVNTVPVFTTLLARVFLEERLRLKTWLGVFVSFAGTSMIAFAEAKDSEISYAALIVLLAALCQSLYFILSKPLLAVYSSLDFTLWAVFTGAILMSPGWNGVHRIWTAPPSSTMAILYLGVFPAAIGYVTWAYALRHAQVSKTVSFLYLVPPLSTAIGWVCLREAPSWMSVGGGVTAMAGVLIVNRRSK
jgi:drug/metabolite transporter (DMT)-like permease